ncbi:DUF5004 domain-containing protein [Mucilaginibacter hurinus]|nr:DUF5004 domain-containing protein [Mucilaginibacter hurinus]
MINNILLKALVCISIIIIMTGVMTSCKTERLKIQPESVKDITGTWKVVKAVRNGSAIFNADGLNVNYGVDYAGFRVNFNSDKTFKLSNNIPFVQNSNGTFSLDNQDYTTLITLKGEGEVPVTANFNYPFAVGKRQLIINFNSGCFRNTYQYTLEKTTE